MKKIKKILIANRGEIAVRIIRACKDIGIKSVAIYSDPDRLAPHVLKADEAYSLGGKASSESYLLMDKVLEIMKISGADAVHPGYGFLSENSLFAKEVEKMGKIFIGPGTEAIDVMGSKTNARTKMINAGVPTVPGTEEAIVDVEAAKKVATEIGFPILIKAAMGGGGKGMRLVEKIEDFDDAIDGAKSEALKAFNDDTVFIEKFVEEPRHIEIQVLADQHGNYLYLFERECSIQRRHQKVIEEAPSAILTPELREKMGQSAIDCAKAVNYYSAGTVEFLVDKHMNYYFLEMNTRLQVEHPVTELITGVDLVKQMIYVAEGRELKIKQSDLKITGHAIESRIYAEDIYNNFMPSTGKINFLKAADGPGIREDAGVEQGNEISLYYDPMVSKLCSWAQTREEAIERMKRALLEYQISGIKTTIPFCLMVMDHKAFLDGKYDTKFVDRYMEEMFEKEADKEVLAALSAAVIHLNELERHHMEIERTDDSEWKKAGKRRAIGQF
jgi:acetyl-CoA carboxylase biotin carboxylase subunit